MAEDLELENGIENNGARQFPGVELIEGPSEGTYYSFSLGETILGRSKKLAQISLDDTSVSRRHVRFFRDGPMITIQDLGSRNGTKLNGSRLVASEETELKHGDKIEIGLYTLRLLMHEASEEDFADEERENNTTDNISEESVEKSPPPPLDPEIDREELAEEIAGDDPENLEALDQIPTDDQTHLAPNTPKRKKKWLKYLLLLFLFIILIFVFLYYYPQLKKVDYKNYFERGVEYVEESISILLDEDESVDPVVKTSKETLPEEIIPLTKPEENKNQNRNKNESPLVITEFSPDDPSFNQEIQASPIFLDIVSSPIRAQIFFNKKELGKTPLKSEMNLVFGKEYEVKAIFDLSEINQKLEKTISFIPQKTQSVVKIEFDIDLGTIVMARLPRFADVYMEGQFVHDPTKTYPIKISDIVYGRPIYVPYGNYQLELREKRSIAGSDSLISSVKYIRKFTIDSESSKFRIEATDEDLNKFPISITTRPEGAEVYLNQERMGRTPYEGNIPHGNHIIEIKKNGFFTEKRKVNIQVNTPFQLDIHLKTSKAGGLLNKGKDYFLQNRLPLAAETLAEAIKSNPNQAEEGEIYYYLGKVAFSRKQYESSLGYFNKAAEFKSFKYDAILGLAEVYYQQNNNPASLRKLIEVFLNVTPQQNSYLEALEVFKRISQFKSVVYINSIPSGAKVTVNDKELTQKTPVILSGLDPRKLNIEITKEGFKTKFIEEKVPFNVFLPLIVELKSD